MMRLRYWFLGLGLVCGLASIGWTARGPGGGWGPTGGFQRLFDPKTVTTIPGEVEKVDTVIPMSGMGRGVHLILKTATEKISVHLGPQWYLDHQEYQVAPKDKIEVRGSRVQISGQSALIAIEVKHDDMTLTLRDADGYPLWSGWRRRHVR